MAELTIPQINTRTLDMVLIRGDSSLELMNGSEVIVQSSKALWSLTWQQRPMKIDETRLWKAFLIQASKIANTFEVLPPDWGGNGANFTGTNPQVVGGGQLGLLLSCDMPGVLNTLVALQGDYLSVNGEFKMLTSDATTDGSGLVTFAFEPALKTDPPDNATVDIKEPKCKMRLIEPKGGWTADISGFYTATVAAIEAQR